MFMSMALGKRRLRVVRDRRLKARVVISGNDLRSGNIPSSCDQTVECEQESTMQRIKPMIAPDDNFYQVDID